MADPKIKEEINNNIVRLSVESADVQEQSDGIRVSGMALPLGQVSRNGFLYMEDSVRQNYGTMKGKPVLFNHNPDKVLGHVEIASVETGGMTYRINLNPNPKSPDLQDAIEAIKRGDVSKVSIQCIYDEDKSYIAEDGSVHAWVNEFLEMSCVTIPGFEDTTAQVEESLGGIASEPGDVDEKTWKKAKKAFRDSYGRDPKSNKDYAIVMSIYKKMRGEEKLGDDNKPTQNADQGQSQQADSQGGQSEEQKVKSLSEATEWLKKNAPADVTEMIVNSLQSKEGKDGQNDSTGEQNDSQKSESESLDKINKSVENLSERMQKLEEKLTEQNNSKQQSSEGDGSSQESEEEKEKRKEEAYKNDKQGATETGGDGQKPVTLGTLRSAFAKM